MVTINVATEATDKDHQRLPTGDEEAVCDEVIRDLRGEAIVKSSKFMFNVMEKARLTTLNLEP
jgi:hypothetical protein